MAVGAAVLAASAAAGWLGQSTAHYIAAPILLGAGWNLPFTAGSTLNTTTQPGIAGTRCRYSAACCPKTSKPLPSASTLPAPPATSRPPATVSACPGGSRHPACRRGANRIRMRAMPTDGQNLCLSCGLCCDGTLYTHAPVGAAEPVEAFRAVGVRIAPDRDGKAATRYRCPACGSRTVVAGRTAAAPPSAPRTAASRCAVSKPARWRFMKHRGSCSSRGRGGGVSGACWPGISRSWPASRSCMRSGSSEGAWPAWTKAGGGGSGRSMANSCSWLPHSMIVCSASNLGGRPHSP